MQRSTAAEIVGGYLAAFSIFVSCASVAWHPVRLVVPAIVLALISAGLSGPHQRLPRAAVAIGGIAWVLGMTVAVVTSHPLW